MNWHCVVESLKIIGLSASVILGFAVIVAGLIYLGDEKGYIKTAWSIAGVLIFAAIFTMTYLTCIGVIH